MSGEEGSTKWELDLDTSHAAEQVEKLGGKLEQLSDPENIAGFIEMFSKLGTVVGLVGASIFAIKESVDLVFDAEKIQALAQGFEHLSENAGISSEKLKEGMEVASKGMLSEAEIMHTATKAVVALGRSAEYLPKVMEVARVAAANTGQDFKATFDLMVRGVEAGNTRMLRQAGIIIDQKKAFDAYAKSIGTSSEMLNKQGQQQAIINALMEMQKTKFAGMGDDVLHATNAWAQFKAAMSDVGESLVLLYDKFFGPYVKVMIDGLAKLAKSAKVALADSFSEDAAHAGKRAQELEVRLASLQKMSASLQKSGFKPDSGEVMQYTNQIKNLEAQLEKLRAKASSAHKGEMKDSAESEAENKKKIAEASIDEEKLALLRGKYKTQLSKLEQEEYHRRLQSATSVGEVNKLVIERELAMKRAAATEISQMEAKLGKNDATAQKLRLQIEATTNAQIKQLQNNLAKEREAALDRYLQKSTSVSEGIARAFEVGSAKQQMALKNFGKIGEMSFKAVGDNAKHAFKAMGDGSKSASEAMASFVLGAIGEMAMNYGEMLLLSGIWPPNPAALAAGGALVALGGFLESKAGGSSSSSSSSSGGGSGSNDAGVPEPPSLGGTADAGPDAQGAAQHNITMVVQGNLYSSNEAKTEMMDLMRQATDATSYKYEQVGG